MQRKELQRLDVYPRVCGGTGKGRNALVGRIGLSPRVRGNLRLRRPPGAPPGSIPACAGEPLLRDTADRYRRVYPRVCGGTLSPQERRAQQGGLSPRVRGNPKQKAQQAQRPGSIPACAGEPAASCRRPPTRTVYPRVCGGTRPGRAAGRAAPGLSPRVRGNHHRSRFRRRGLRSIPACAGEPGRYGAAPAARRVYPRVCGGTPDEGEHGRGRRGLSPRVRGNPRLWCG